MTERWAIVTGVSHWNALYYRLWAQSPGMTEWWANMPERRSGKTDLRRLIEQAPQPSPHRRFGHSRRDRPVPARTLRLIERVVGALQDGVGSVPHPVHDGNADADRDGDLGDLGR